MSSTIATPRSGIVPGAGRYVDGSGTQRGYARRPARPLLRRVTGAGPTGCRLAIEGVRCHASDVRPGPPDAVEPQPSTTDPDRADRR